MFWDYSLHTAQCLKGLWCYSDTAVIQVVLPIINNTELSVAAGWLRRQRQEDLDTSLTYTAEGVSL